MSPWSISIAATATSTGNIQQLFPDWCTVGTTATTPGSLRRKTSEGVYKSLTITPDGTNGGLFELWDIDGEEAGANINTAAVISAAQLAAAIAAGKARLIKTVLTTGSASVQIPISTGGPFLKGLAARFSNSGVVGTLQFSAFVSGGCRKTEIVG
jgi:hypothetical protein